MESVLLTAIFSSLFFTVKSTPQISPTDSQIPFQEHSNKPALIQELQEVTLQIARLESIFEDKIQEINTISLYIGEKKKVIDEMTHEINRLQSVLTSFKDNSSHAHERINALEKEVRHLWDASRKNNFEIYNLELKAQDAEKRLVAITERVENLAAIVSEQWTQVQHLEQAVQMAEVRALKVKTALSSRKCPFLKYTKNGFSHHLDKVKEILSPYFPNKEPASNSYMSQALHQLMRASTAAKYYHHQLQGVVKEAMEMHVFTAVLANEEVVFFVASALILIPMMSACMLLSSHLS